ncbi:hypothetical protein [Lacipirellula sp.]|uniref:hypothetical protein n=1 Tax=Lacipirellula sp. TaxID=2691419 RepID=UPI003D12C321
MRDSEGGGQEIIYGLLVKTIDANSALYGAVYLYDLPAGGWFTARLDADGELVTWTGCNPSLYSAIRGDVVTPIRVWGVAHTLDSVPNPDYDSEDEESEEYFYNVPAFMILGFIDPLAAADGFVLNPDNDRGQLLMHHDGSKATVAEGGPCGDEGG